MKCDGTPRRDFLQLGLQAMTGLGLAGLLEQRAFSALATGAKPINNCILVWLDGGPTHYETFDPKPDAPKEVRGEFKSIPTSVTGLHYSELVPELAKMADRFTTIRSIYHKSNNHGSGNHHLMTGMPTPVPVNCGAHVSFHPSFGSMVAHDRGVQQGLPPYMTLGRQSRSGGPNFLGAEHAPFLIANDPNSESFKVRDVVLPSKVTDDRAIARRAMRSELDTLTRFADRAVADPALDFDRFIQQGVDLVTAPEAQAAFDIGREDSKVREEYGRSPLGQRLLLARRLVEVGVSFVTVYYGGWDHHTNIFSSLKKHLPPLDQSLATLIRDLDDRGLLDTTLVLCLGEFGRTPKINERGGRDHWSNAMSVIAAGAGVPRGQVIGATDSKGYYAAEDTWQPEDLACTIYRKLGIDPHQVLHNRSGRPVPLVNGGQPIPSLFG